MSEVTPAAQVTPNAAEVTSVTPPAAEAPKTSVVPESKTAEPAKAPEVKADKVTTETPKAEPAKEKTEVVEPKKEEPSQTEQKKVVPEKYELKLPKESSLTAEHVEALSQEAKEKGLSNEEAQAMLERDHKVVSKYQADLKDSQTKMTNEWFEQAKQDKELGGDAFKQKAEVAKRVVDRFGTDSFKKELNKTGLGNHPELLRVFSRIGEAMSDDQLIHPGQQTTGKKKSIESILYGDSKKER